MTYAITIDGPAGCGKSTLAKNLQKKLRAFTLIDTGAYYRWATRLCLDNEVDINKKSEVYKLVKDRLDLSFFPYPRGHKYYSAKIYFGAELINKKLYTREVTDNVPILAIYPRIRSLVKKKIIDLAKDHNIIVAGRDIGTEVLPKAKVKIFLNPSVDSRARRRYRDEVKQGKSISLAKLKESMSSRDKQDKERDHGPLKKPDDALEIDNTYYTPTQTWQEVLKYIHKTIPEVEDIEPVKHEIPAKASLGYDWVSDSSSSTSTSESTQDLKKRLKNKYKKMSGGAGGGGFFGKY